MHGHPARAIARRHEKVIEDLLAELLLSAGVRSARRRARQIYILLEGAAAMILVHGDRSYASAAAEVGNLILVDRAPMRKQRSPSRRSG
jgi:hypothetical protein